MASATEQSGGDTDEKVNATQDNVSDTPWVASSLYYLFVVIFIGVPMWFYTCSKTRYSIPDLVELERNILQSPPRFHLEISVVQLARFDAFKVDDEISSYTDKQTSYLRSNLPIHLDTSIEDVTYDINWRVRRPTQDEFKAFQLYQQQRVSTNESLSNGLLSLEKQLIKIHRPTNRFKMFFFMVEEKYYQDFCNTLKTHTYTVSSERFVYLCPSLATTTHDNYSSIVTLIETVLEETFKNTVDQEKVKHILGRQIDLLFSLVPEVQEHFDKLSLLAQKIHSIYKKNVGETFPDIKELVNISPITQFLIDLLSKDFLDKLLEKQLSTTNTTTGNEVLKPRLIKLDRVAQLFRDLEMRTNKHSTQNVHNVLVISPNPELPPMSFKGTSPVGLVSILEGQEMNTMFLANDDKSLVLGVRAIVRRVIGLSSVDICSNCLVRRDLFFNRWELDALMGAFTLKKLKSTFISLQSISHQLIGVKIPKDIAAIASEAHNAALESINFLKTKRLQEAYRMASKAYEKAETAYYNPSLLESSYFPEDLKYAIYTPFFVPLALSFATSFKELIGYLRRKMKEPHVKLSN